MQTRGFALLEATAALFVVSVGVFGVVQFFETGARELRAAHESEIAARLLRNELAYLTALPFEQLDPRESEAFAMPAPEMDALVNAAPRVRVSAHPEYPESLREVTVQIAWLTTHGRRADRSLSTLIARGGE